MGPNFNFYKLYYIYIFVDSYTVDTVSYKKLRQLASFCITFSIRYINGSLTECEVCMGKLVFARGFCTDRAMKERGLCEKPCVLHTDRANEVINKTFIIWLLVHYCVPVFVFRCCHLPYCTSELLGFASCLHLLGIRFPCL